MSIELKTKQEEYQRLLSHAKDLSGKYPQTMPDDVDRQLTVMNRDLKTLQVEIQTMQRQEANRQGLAEATDWFERPQPTIPHGINGDDDDRKMLRDRGWEAKGGILYAPTSLGTTHPMFPEDVLFGDIPTDDPDRATFYKTTRAAFSPEYKAAYTKYLRTASRHGEGVAMGLLSPSEQKALSEGSDPAGGFLVPPDMQAEVLARTAQMSVMRRLARVINTNRDRVQFPSVAPNATSPSIYSSGFVGGWVGETPAFSDTDPQFQQFEISIKKARVATKLSNDFIADAAVNPLSWLAQNGAENMALVLDNGFIAGDGSPLQPLGILNTPNVSTVDVEGSTTDTISNTTSNAGSALKLIDVQYAIPAQYVGRASWLMRRAIEGKIRKLTDASGRPMWLGVNESAFGVAGRTLMGDPVYNSDFMPNDGTDANKVAVYGDLSQYIIAERAQITSVVLRERFADSDQTGIILFARVGGALWNYDAIRFAIV